MSWWEGKLGLCVAVGTAGKTPSSKSHELMGGTFLVDLNGLHVGQSIPVLLPMPPPGEIGAAKKAAWVLGPQEMAKPQAYRGPAALPETEARSQEQRRRAGAWTTRVSNSGYASLAADVSGLRACKLQHSSKAVSLEKSEGQSQERPRGQSAAEEKKERAEQSPAFLHFKAQSSKAALLKREI